MSDRMRQTMALLQWLSTANDDGPDYFTKWRESKELAIASAQSIVAEARAIYGQHNLDIVLAQPGIDRAFLQI